MEELLARHRKEQRELQGRITSKRKNATKKTRKGVNDECESLERELRQKQHAEIAALSPSSIENGIAKLDLANEGEGSSPSGDTDTEKELKTPTAKTVHFDGNISDSKEAVTPPTQQSKKPNRQKARLARRAAEQEAQAAAAAEEAANLPDLREQEMSAMKTQREKHGLVETFIRPDGHCLYSACALGMSPDQVKKSGPYTEPYQNVRAKTADFIKQHPDDFSAFLEEPLDAYVNKIKNTAEWGGQLELQAIARAYKINIHVLQADGRIEDINSDSASSQDSEDVWLAYYRHSFGLGEHYNALKKAEKT